MANAAIAVEDKVILHADLVDASAGRYLIDAVVLIDKFVGARCVPSGAPDHIVDDDRGAPVGIDFRNGDPVLLADAGQSTRSGRALTGGQRPTHGPVVNDVGVCALRERPRPCRGCSNISVATTSVNETNLLDLDIDLSLNECSTE